MSLLKHYAFGRVDKLLKWNVIFALESSNEVLFFGQVRSHIYIWRKFSCDSLTGWLILLYKINIGFRRYNLYEKEEDGNVLVYGVYMGIR